MKLKLYFKGETVQYKWLYLCRRADGFLVLYWRFPWKVWKYSINCDDIVKDYPAGAIWLRIYSEPLFGHKRLKKDAHTTAAR